MKGEFMKIGEYLVQRMIITKADLEKALQEQSETKKGRLCEILVREGKLQGHDLFSIVSEFLKETGEKPSIAREWISQEEIDKLEKSFHKHHG